MSSTANLAAHNMRLSFSSFFFLAYCIYRCVIYPVIASIAMRKVMAKMATRKPNGETPPLPRRIAYVKGVTSGVLFAGIALVVGLPNKIPILGSSRIDIKSLMFASAFLVLNLGLDSLEWKHMSAARKKRLRSYLPDTIPERVLWAPVSLIVATGEEIVFRAVLFGLLYQMVGDYWIAAVISAVFFAFMHLASWGWLSLIDLFFVALGLQWLVQVSGGLYIAIAVHFFHNLINGIVYGAMSEPGPDNALAECKAVDSKISAQTSD